MLIKIKKFLKSKIWYLLTRDYRRGTLGKLDFMDNIGEFKKLHPELKSADDIKLLKAWQHGKFNFLDYKS